MNKERIFDTVNEANDSYGWYHKISARYYKKHGYHAFLDPKRGYDVEEEAIDRAYNNQWADTQNVVRLWEIFELDAEQIKRLYIASRFLRRWYERENWEFCASRDLIDRLWDFVIG